MGKNCAIVADSVERSLPPPSQAEKKKDTAGECEILSVHHLLQCSP